MLLLTSCGIKTMFARYLILLLLIGHQLYNVSAAPITNTETNDSKLLDNYIIFG